MSICWAEITVEEEFVYPQTLRKNKNRLMEHFHVAFKHCYFTTYEECNAIHRMAELFLDNFKDLDVISLLVKYYMPLAHINKVIKLLKF